MTKDKIHGAILTKLKTEFSAEHGLRKFESEAETKAENKGPVPNTVEQQNLGHNAKKEGLGPNTRL